MRCDKATRRANHQNPVHPSRKKIFPLPPSGKSPLQARPVPTRQEGRSRSSRNAGRDAVDADVPLTNGTEADGEVVWSWRPDAGAKFGASSMLRMTVARKPGHRGELEVSRKPPRREGRIASAEPVCSCALSSVHFAHETAGAARTRSSLRPLFSKRAERLPKTSRKTCGGIAKPCLRMKTQLPLSCPGFANVADAIRRTRRADSPAHTEAR